MLVGGCCCCCTEDEGEKCTVGATLSEGATQDLVAGELLGVVGEEVAVFVLYPI
jgi:hypothetical protein